MKINCKCCIFVLLLMTCSSTFGTTFFVSDYGAYPNDDRDDTYAIQTAINDAIRSKSVNDVVFGYGIYQISSAIFVINAVNLTIIGQGIDQTFLIGVNPIAIFSLHTSQGLKLSSFSIDFDPLPFTAGYVVDVNDQYLDIQVVPPHKADIDRKVFAILRYDPVQMRPAFGPETYEIYQHPPDEVNTTVVSPNVLRIPLSLPTQFRNGDPIVARYLSSEHTIYIQSVTDTTLQSITMYTSWRMGVIGIQARRLTITDYHTVPRERRWMSTIVDCLHFIDTREYLLLTNSQCQSMGDDALNVHGVFFLVTAVLDSSTIIIYGVNGTGPLDVGVGTTLEFTSEKQPFTAYGNGTVASIVFNSSYSRKVTFTTPVNISVDDWVCVADTPHVYIRNFTVSHNRARGVLLESRNIDIRQSVFNQTSGPAVLIQPSMYWHEGPAAHNVSLTENLYINNNEGLTQNLGVITILPNPVQLTPVINNVRIESSTFYFGTYTKGLLQSDNADSVYINGNYISVNSSAPLVSICNSRNISAANNCVVTSGEKIDQYYTFDTSAPCSMNLSSLIDLPASAFNSSFPPPVIF